ncbi:MAG: ABC transporter permease subunit [Candidatus Thorarchaeota archaeon]|nr:ABC transporter permease subunit [Candidatus Thorarchaeota archaeon]
MNKSMVVALTDFKIAMNLRFVKWGIVLGAIFGPVISVFMILSFVTLVPASEFPMLWAIMGPYIPAMIAIFAIIPTSMISANALVGEREMNTLEPLLCTPLTDRELLWGKTLTSAIPGLLILISSTVITTVASLVIFVVMDFPLMLVPDIAGYFMLFTSVPLMIFAMVAVMIIVSGRVTRVYEAYQTTSAVIMVFILPMILPIFGMESGNVEEWVWISNFIILIVAALIFAISWAIAFKLFNRDKLVSMV